MPATLMIKDLSPKFLTFYELAQDADPEQRWALWEKHYGFAAVPPTGEGMAMARRLLDGSFHRYADVLDVIRAGAAAFRPDPQQVLDAVCQLLQFDGDMTVRLVIYVGNFEQNAFAFAADGVPVVNVPLEESDEWRSLIMPHEFTHAVHSRLSNNQGGWLRSIGYSMMQEGLAMHAAMRITPGYPEEAYHEIRPGWLAECREKERPILEGIRPHLADASNEALSRFIFGTGSAGVEREVYYAGYRVVGHLLNQGHTLAELARIDEEDTPAFMEAAISKLLASA